MSDTDTKPDSLLAQRHYEQLQKNLDRLIKPGKIPIEHYAEIGSRLYKLNLVLEYLELQANTKGAITQKEVANAPAPNDKAPNTRTSTRVDLKSRLDSKRFDFLEKLRLNCWEALQTARLLLNELKCNTLPEDLLEEIEDYPQRVAIKSNPPCPVMDVPTELSVWFHRSDYEHSPARDELFCSWQFDSGPAEKGWTVWHAFETPGVHKVTVTFRDASGHAVMGRGGAAIQVEANYSIPAIGRKGKYHRGIIQGLHFLVSLIVVVVALMAGAKEKIDTLDSLTAIGALIGIGFAASTVQNLIAPANTKAS